MELLSSGFFTDSSGERIGLIIKGKEVLAAIYDSITPFSDECYKPKYPRSSCYIIHNNNGYGLYFNVYLGTDVIIDTQYDSIDYAGEIRENAYFRGRKGNTYTILSNNFDFNTNSSIYFEESKIDNIEFVEKCGFKIFHNNRVGFIDHYGFIKIPIVHKEITCILYKSYIADGIWKTYDGKVLLDLNSKDLVFLSHQHAFVIFYSEEKKMYLFYTEKGVEIWTGIEETEKYIIIHSSYNSSYKYSKKNGILKEMNQYGSYQEYQDQLQRDIEIGTRDYYNCDPEAQWNTD